MDSSQGEPCQQGLCALTALALLLKDVNLAKLALVELQKADIKGESLYQRVSDRKDGGHVTISPK